MTFLTAYFFALFLAGLLIGFYLGYHRGVHAARTDPVHIDRMARKDRKIEHLETSLAKVTQQRNSVLDAYRLLKDRQKGAV